METETKPGKILTFYSYKGGTGRSMALANVAWILASAGKSVLVIDWDLEAPGLHRYFRPFLIDHRLTASPGLIDFVIRYATEAVKPSTQVTPDWIATHANLLDYRISLDWDFPHGGALHLVPAGKQDVTYAARVSTFNWQKFYEKLGGGVLMNAVRDRIRYEYDYILIDSRTGVSDTAGICTVQLPDELVVCFTYNNQSTEGAAGVARSVFQQKFVEGGESSFRVHPVPMRVDPFEEVRLKRRQQHARKLFEPLLIDAPADRVAYWANVEVPNIAAFAYEEVLSTFSDEPSDPKRLLAAMIRVTASITRGEVPSFRLLAEPHERAEVLARFADVEGEDEVVVPASYEDPMDAAVRRAERVYASLMPEEQVSAKWLWLRMVRITTEEETSDLARIRLPIKELDPDRVPRHVIDRFEDAGVIVRSVPTGEEKSEERLEPLNDGLINRWGRIAEWVAAHRDYVVWRQSMRTQLQAFRGNPLRTLRGSALKQALQWLARENDLSRIERAFVRYSRLSFIAQVGSIALLIIGALAVLYLFATDKIQERRALVEDQRRNLARASYLLELAEKTTDPLKALLVVGELKDLPEPPGGLARARKLFGRPIPRAVVDTDLAEEGQRFAFSPNGKLFAGPAGAAGHGVTIWSAADGVPLYRGVDFGWKFTGVSFLDNRTLLAATESSDVIRATVDAANPLTEQDQPLRLSRLVTVGRPEPIHIRALTDRTIFTVKRSFGISFGDENGRAIQSLAYSAQDRSLWNQWDVTPDGRVFVTSAPGIVTIHRRDVAAKVTLRLRDVHAVALSPDGSMLAVAYAERIRVLATSQLTPATEILRERAVTALAFSSDGKRLAWGEWDGVVMVWDRQSSVAALRGHSAVILEIIFSPDGETIATRALGEGIARLWSTETTRVVAPRNWQSIAHAVDLRTTTCLSSAQRQELLFEGASEALLQWQRCAARRGTLIGSTIDLGPLRTRGGNVSQ